MPHVLHYARYQWDVILAITMTMTLSRRTNNEVQ
jgi:hypothetical protein